MSEPATSSAPGFADSNGHRTTLTDERIDSILDDFRAWLRDIAAEPTVDSPEPESVDMYSLVAQFTALRHEINLQTRAVRQQQELNAAALHELEQAVELARRPSSPSSDTIKSCIVALMDAADVQWLAARELNRVSELLEPMLAELDREPKVPEPAPPGFFGRMLGADSMLKAIHAISLDAQSRRRELLRQIRAQNSSAASGVELGLQRIERVMQRLGLEPIAALGRPFDPEQMEAVEAVPDSGRPAGEVLAEVRRGYLLDGVVHRFAQVKVAR